VAGYDGSVHAPMIVALNNPAHVAVESACQCSKARRKHLGLTALVSADDLLRLVDATRKFRLRQSAGLSDGPEPLAHFDEDFLFEGLHVFFLSFARLRRTRKELQFKTKPSIDFLILLASFA
jgi:hypothetical protein